MSVQLSGPLAEVAALYDCQKFSAPVAEKWEVVLSRWGRREVEAAVGEIEAGRSPFRKMPSPGEFSWWMLRRARAKAGGFAGYQVERLRLAFPSSEIEEQSADFYVSCLERFDPRDVEAAVSSIIDGSRMKFFPSLPELVARIRDCEDARRVLEPRVNRRASDENVNRGLALFREQTFAGGQA